LNDLTIVNDQMDSELPGKRVNFYKFHVLGNILNSICFCQKSTFYDFVENQPAKSYLSVAITLHSCADVDSLVTLSRAREPPMPSSDSMVFGVDLTIAIDRTGVMTTTTEGMVPSFLRDIVEVLRKDENKNTLGLFRKSGNQTNIKKMKMQIDRVGSLIFEMEQANPHDLAGLLKLYFAELPDPLFTGQLYHRFIALSELKDNQKKLEGIQGLMQLLPKAHLEVAIYLLQFLWEVSLLSTINQMHPKNLAVCFSPSLFGKRKHQRAISKIQGRVTQALETKKDQLATDMKKQESVTNVLEMMIQCYLDLMQGVMFGKEKINYTRRGSNVQFN